MNNLFKNTANAGEETLDEFFFEDIACVIVDEVHMAKADVLKTMLTGVFSNIPIRWGLTGTIPKDKMDQVSLLVSLGPVIGKLSAKELQDRGVLAQCHVNIVQLKDKVEFTNYQSELKHLLEDPNRLDTIAALIEKVNLTGNTLVLVDRVNAGKEIVSRLGSNAVFVNGGTGLTERTVSYTHLTLPTKRIV